LARRKNIKNSGTWKSQVVWSVATVAILALLCLAVQKRAATALRTVRVEIIDLKDKKNLLTEKAVLDKCRQHLGYDLAASTVGELDLRELETMLNADSRIKDAQVYVTNQQVLTIGVLQKQPIVRVQGDGDTAYYLTDEGEAIPLQKGHTLRVPLATGAVGKYGADKIFGDKPNHLQDVYRMAKHIYEDQFLAALVEQISVDRNGEFILVPKVGKQQLVFGKAEQIEDRFENLKIFYKEGMPKVGWRKYDRLVLNWDGQVVAQK